MSQPSLRAVKRDPMVRDLIVAAEAQGWTVSMTSKSHVRFRAPGGRSVFHSGTSGDRRSHRNLRAELRRHGLDV